MAVTDAALHGRHGPDQRLVLGKQPPQRDARRHLCQQIGFMFIWLAQAQYLSEQPSLVCDSCSKNSGLDHRKAASRMRACRRFFEGWSHQRGAAHAGRLAGGGRRMHRHQHPVQPRGEGHLLLLHPQPVQQQHPRFRKAVVFNLLVAKFCYLECIRPDDTTCAVRLKALSVQCMVHRKHAGSFRSNAVLRNLQTQKAHWLW